MKEPRQATAKPSDAKKASETKKTSEAKKTAAGKKHDESAPSTPAAPIEWTSPPFMVAYAIAGLVVVVFAVKWLFFSGPSGPALTRVTGIVTMDGKPVASADVTFHPSTKQASPAFGRTDRLGHFDMKTGGTGKGVMIDEYRVTVTKITSEEKIMSPDEAKTFTNKEGKAPPAAKPTNVLPEIYASADKTPLRAPVKSRRPVRLTFDLKK
jgi:hypothetical protein